MRNFGSFFRAGKQFLQRNADAARIVGVSTALTSAYLYHVKHQMEQHQIYCHTKQELDLRLAQRYSEMKGHDADFANVVIFSGNAHVKLADDIAKLLGQSLGKAVVGHFSDGEVQIQLQENVRSKDVYVIQPTCTPVNDNLVELLLLVSTLRRASARRITVVVPYYGYSRQDRKDQARVPISAADVARLLETVGIDRMVSVDLHCGQIQGFFPPRVPVDNLEAQIVALNYFVNADMVPEEDYVVVSPDAGGVARAKKFRELLNFKLPDEKKSDLAMIIKQRDAPGKIGQMNLVGNVKDKNVIIIDDMIDTAGTLCEAAKALKQHGAKKVFAFATHGLFNGKAFENIAKSELERVIVTDTVPAKPGEEGVHKIVRLSIAPILASAIFRLQTKKSISELFRVNKAYTNEHDQPHKAI